MLRSLQVYFYTLTFLAYHLSLFIVLSHFAEFKLLPILKPAGFFPDNSLFIENYSEFYLYATDFPSFLNIFVPGRIE